MDDKNKLLQEIESLITNQKGMYRISDAAKFLSEKHRCKISARKICKLLRTRGVIEKRTDEIKPTADYVAKEYFVTRLYIKETYSKAHTYLTMAGLLFVQSLVTSSFEGDGSNGW